ncbi:hypothetical protein ACFUC1_09355 [Pedococcus sp. NPDC057267]|uniref:hypothetical protein n=1 Tax=Pedococcus sp. NPDC057267 TaxID=3346077 RepID=UPI003631E2BB
MPTPSPSAHADDAGSPHVAKLAKLLDDVEHARVHVPAWLRATSPENRLPVAFAILVAIALQLRLTDRYGLHPRWLLPALELALLVVLSVINPVRLNRSTRLGRSCSVVLVAVITIDNAVSAGALDASILRGRAGEDAIALMASGAAIYATNVIAFGIWYWELDRGGPFQRARGTRPHPDFLFPQMSDPHLASPDWEPLFVDYLYVSLTNVFAFSPTDTLPLSRWAKSLMACQSVVALSTTALVVARAVNILK